MLIFKTSLICEPCLKAFSINEINNNGAILIPVSSEGKLQVELEDELVKDFGLKEIKFL